MAYQLPKIAQDVRRLRKEIEVAVSNFANFHKRASGDILRDQVRTVQRLCRHAWEDQENALMRVALLREGIDQLKDDMQLSADVEAFQSRRQFEHLYRQADEIGRQAGGWYKKQQQKHPSAQSPQGHRAGAERGQILSTHATPAGVNA